MQGNLSQVEAEAFAEEGQLPARRRQAWRYLAVMIAGGLAAVLFCAGLAVRDIRSKDHVGQITLGGDSRWYQNYAHGYTREMQDRDVLFHRIGHSIKHLQQADIIILGHSVLQFGIVDSMVQDFARANDLKIYNLTTPGIASGEFIRRVIRKYKLQPKLWIINADDYPANFFSGKLDDFFASGRNSVFEIVKSTKLQAYLHVITRSIRWRTEAFALQHWPAALGQPPQTLQHSTIATWRNTETGNYYLDRSGSYAIPGKPFLQRADQNCATSPEEVALAQSYLAAIGQTTVLTLVPYDYSCSTRVRQLADELAVESVIVPDTDFAGSDGRHMTKAGAERFTRELLAEFSQSRAFKVLKGQPDPGLPPRSTRPVSASTIRLCLSNPGSDRLFVSLRNPIGAIDHALDPGGSIQVPGSAQAVMCSSNAPFNRDACPNERPQQSAACP